MEFIGSLCLILITTSIGGHICARINLPAVIGQLIAGILLGPALLGWVSTNSFISFFSEIGVIILMFIAGLESNLNLLRRFLIPSTVVAIVGVIFPVIIAYLTGLYFHLSQLESLFLGITFAATSVSISVAVLKEMNQLDSFEGTTILGAAVVDDILAVIILSVLISFTGGQVKGQGSSQNLFFSLTLPLGYFVLLFVFGRFLVPKLMQISEKFLVPASEIVMSLIICLGLSYLANLSGLSDVIGAFFAGIAIGQTHYKQLIDQNIGPLGYGIFIPVFFVSIGLKITLNGIVQDLGLFLILSLGGILSKFIGAGLGAKLVRFSRKSSLVIGSAMISRGEMALIIAQLGLRSRLLSSDTYSAVIGAIIMTTLAAPLLLRVTITKKAKR